MTAVTMYTTSWCGYCFRLKKVLEEEGIRFVEVDIEADPAGGIRDLGQRRQSDRADAEVRRWLDADQPERARGQGEAG
jgi:hypothetical protein